MPMRDWNTALYMKFDAERTRAARDLLAQVPKFNPQTIYDLGCGPGNSTQLLVDAFPKAKVIGLDSSHNMLEVARETVPHAAFIKQDILTWAPDAPVDLIFSNAALHFLPDHHELIIKLVSFLRPGGVLALQMPNNIQELSHALMRMIAADWPWSKRLVPIAKTRAVIGATEDYYGWLTSVCTKVDLWLTTYIHPLDGADGIIEWFVGSGLRPFLEPLTPGERDAFLAIYRAELVAAYPHQPNGKVLLRYPRLFFVVER